nr:unnamed protein product [Callosobruchus analis]
MKLSHPFQRHVCFLFLSIAVLTTYLSLKHKSGKYSRFFTASNYSDIASNESSAYEDFFNVTFDVSGESEFVYFVNFSEVDEVESKENADVKTVYILGLFELSTKWGRRIEGESEMLAAKLAVNHVNRFNVIPGYRLQLLINDTKCDPGVGIDRFFYALYSNKKVLMLLGSGCSNVTERLAQVVPYWNILQVSFGSTSPYLSDRNKFPLFFRTVAPDSSHNDAKIHFIKKFGWKVVATFTQSENEYLLPINRLITDLENANVACMSTVTFSLDNYFDQLKVLKELDTRVIVGSFSASILPQIFCAIYDLKMMDEYVWILQNRVQNWWSLPKKCTDYALKQATSGILLFSEYNDLEGSGLSISGMNSDRFEEALNISKSHISQHATQSYDAVWAIALTLRHNWLVRLEDFQYTDKDLVCKWMRTMESLKFIGLSGPLKFKGADRIGNSIIRQVQDGIQRDIAIFDSITNTLDFNCGTCHRVIWKDNKIPIAQRILKISMTTIPNALFYAVTVVSLIGIGISFIFLCINLYFRKLRTLKLSSPKLNNVAVVGCILVYCSVILLGINNTTIKSNLHFSKLCFAKVYLLSAGFSLTFGSMLAKTYRVHRLFTYSCAGLVRDKLLKDKQLIVLIMIPLIVDAVILTLWVIIDPMERHIYNFTLEADFSNRGIVYQPQVESCSCHNTPGWYLALFGYKSIILIMGIFMAWKTRHVKVPALNDSQHIGICVYGTVFTTIIVIFFSFISEYVIFTYIAKSVCILISTTLSLVLLLLPKLKLVFCKIDPITQSMGLKIESNTRRFISDDPKEFIHRLEIQNKVYRCEIAELDKEISRLEKLLSSQPSSSTGPSSSSLVKAKGSYLNVPCSTTGRASWPSTTMSDLKSYSKDVFLSENKLNSEASDKLKFFGKLKKYFVSFSALQTVPQESDFTISTVAKSVPASSVEAFEAFDELDRVSIAKAKSDLELRKSKATFEL